MPRGHCETSAAPWQLEGDLFRDPRLAARGVRHGLSHRRLGPMRSADARDAMAQKAGVASPLYLTQVHGNRVLQAHEEFVGLAADGWVTDEPGASIGVFVADCLPVLLYTDDLCAVGAVHAGWRGLAAGVLESALAGFGKLGAAPRAVNAAIGPHISGAAYEVGPEFRGIFPAASLREAGGKLYFDQGAEALRRLAAAGVGADKISLSSDCTLSREADLLSFRRDGKRRNMMAFIERPREPAA